MTTKEIRKQTAFQKIHNARVKRAVNNIKIRKEGNRTEDTADSNIINTVCIIALTLAVILTGIWSLKTIIN